MVNIKKVWLVTMNRDEEDSGISRWNGNLVNLTVDINGADPYDNAYFISTKRGCGNFAEGFSIPAIGEIFDSNSLTNSSIRLGVYGDDAWGPDNILVLGITDPPEGQSRVLPLAVEVDQQTWMSTDVRDGDPARLSIPVRLVAPGNTSTIIRRVLLLVQTQDFKNAGTDDPIEIEITAAGSMVAKQAFGGGLDTPQDDLERGATNWYLAGVMTPFTKADVQSNGKIKLTIKFSIPEDDAWDPKRIFVYGFDTA